MHPAEQVDHQDAAARCGVEQPRSPARAIGQRRIVEGPDQARLAHDIGQGLLLVPGVVAQGQAVGAGLEQFARGVLGDAETSGGVLGVDHHELQAQAAFQVRQMIGQTLAARTPDHVSKKSYAHHSSS
jgi:hypothetical protein